MRMRGACGTCGHDEAHHVPGEALPRVGVCAAYTAQAVSASVTPPVSTAALVARAKQDLVAGDSLGAQTAALVAIAAALTDRAAAGVDLNDQLHEWLVTQQDIARQAMLRSEPAEARYHAGRVDALRDVLAAHTELGKVCQ